MKISLDFARPAHVPTRQYIEYLIQRNLVDAQIGRGYVDGYEQARFSRIPVNQDVFKDIMAHLAVVLRQMGYVPQNPSNQEETSSISTRSDSTSHHLPQLDVVRRKSSSATGNNADPSSSIGMGGGSPYDDDVASLAQSIATWTSRSTSNTRSRYARSSSQRSTSQVGSGTPDESAGDGGYNDNVNDSDEYDDDDENRDDYDQHIRRVIYSRLMVDR